MKQVKRFVEYSSASLMKMISPEDVIRIKEFFSQIKAVKPKAGWAACYLVPSSSSNKKYRVARRAGRDYWSCDCKGWIFNKHIEGKECIHGKAVRLKVAKKGNKLKAA